MSSVEHMTKQINERGNQLSRQISEWLQGRAEKIRAPPQPLGPGGPGPLTNGLGGLGPLANGIGGPGPLSLWPQGLRGPLAYGFRGSGPLEYG